MAKIKKSSKKVGVRLKKTPSNQKSKKKSTTKKSGKPVSRILKKGAARKKPVKPAKKHTQTVKDKHLIAVAASAKDAIIMVDSSGLVSYWNPGAEKIFGYKSNEVVGKKLDGYIIPKKYRKAHLKGLANFKKTGKGKVIGKTVELEGLRKDGKEFPIELSLSSFKQDGEWYATGIIRDITSRKLLEEALRSSEEQFRILIENSADCICYISLDAKYLYMSPGGLRHNELKSLDAIRGKDCIEDTTAEFKDAMRNAIERAKRGETVSLEYVSTTYSGKEMWWDSSINPIKDDKGKVTKLIRFSKNITERKRVEKSLKESSRLLEESQSVANLGTYTLDIPSGSWSSSGILDEIFGITDQEFKRNMEGWVQIVHPDHREEMLSYLKKHVLEKHGKFDKEYRINRLDDKQERWVHGLGKLVLDENQNPVKMIGTIQDITERKRTEDMLKNTNERYDMATEVGQIGTWDWNPATGVLIWNDETYRILGQTKGKISPSYELFLELVHPDDKDLLNRAVEEASDKKKPYNVDCRIILENGEERVCHTTGNVTYDNDGKPIRMLGTFQDITKRKKAEELTARFGRILEKSSNEIYIFDAAKLHFIQVNQGARKNLGYSMEELTKLTPLDLKPEYTGKTFSELIEPLLNGDRDLVSFATVHKRKNGSLYPVDVRLNYFDSETPPLFVAIVQDITERKQLEQQLIHTEKLSSIGTFVSGVAHELNNPLTAILGYAGLLQDDYKSLPQNIKEDIDNIKVQSERASEIVNNLLRFTRKKKPEKSGVKINDILENSINLHEYNLKTSGIEIIKDYEDSLPFIYADVNHLQQVLTNIILNFHYEITKAHGKGIITIKSKKSGSSIVVTLENDGPPVPKKLLSKIFDPFFTTKSIGEGTGLGLYVSYGIIQDHGGNMWAENIGKSGVRFVITLPIYDEGVEKPEPKIGEITDLQGKRILFVDDEKIIRDWITRVLMKEGISVQSVSSGEEAVKLIEQSEFDIIISDVKMPGMNGLELGKWLLKNRPDYLKRFILATGAIEPEIETYCSLYKCRLITKPFKTQKLLEAVSEIILQKE